MESAELSLFVFLLDIVRSRYVLLNKNLTFLHRKRERRKDVSEEILQVGFTFWNLFWCISRVLKNYL